MREFFKEAPEYSPRDPQTAAQQAMRPILPKRFYKNVEIASEPEAPTSEASKKERFAIHLDGRTVKTPARNTLLLPTIEAAQIVADEWSAQGEKIDAATMPATRLVNTASDGIQNDPQAVIDDMLKFASSDLLCYRATTPPGLVEQQTKHWDPILDWVESEIGAQFETTQSVIQIAQPKQAIASIEQALKQWPDPIAIGALHTFTNLTGSIILALAVATGKYDAAQVWKIAHVDEDWNISTWGEDYEAKKRRDNRWKEMEAAYLLFLALKDQS